MSKRTTISVSNTDLEIIRDILSDNCMDFKKHPNEFDSETHADCWILENFDYEDEEEIEEDYMDKFEDDEYDWEA